MRLVEIVPAHSREHRMAIKAMTKELKISYKRWEAVAELAVDGILTALLIGIHIAFAVAFVRWWLCV